MRSCASLFRRRRGPAGLRDPFSSVEIVACMPCAQGLSACARHGRYHYPRRALRASETLDARLSKGLICRFLRSGGRSSPHDSCFLANTQNFLPTAPVANTFALWYDKFDKLEVVSSFIFIFFEKIRLPDIPKDIPRHTPIPIPAMLFKTFIKTTLQSIAAVIPIVTPIIILLLFISFILHKFRFVCHIIAHPQKCVKPNSTPKGDLNLEKCNTTSYPTCPPGGGGLILCPAPRRR